MQEDKDLHNRLYVSLYSAKKRWLSLKRIKKEFSSSRFTLGSEKEKANNKIVLSAHNSRSREWIEGKRGSLSVIANEISHNLILPFGKC